MTTVTPTYGTEVAVTLNPDGLASGSAMQSAAVDLTVAQGGQTGAPDNVIVCILAQTATGTLGSSPNITVYAAALATGTNYTDGCTGTAGSFTPPSSPASVPIVVLPFSASNAATPQGGVSLAAAFGGDLPAKVCFWWQNNAGLAGAGTSGQAVNNKLTFRPVQYTAQ